MAGERPGGGAVFRAVRVTTEVAPRAISGGSAVGGWLDGTTTHAPEYDFTKAEKNPYAARFKRRVTNRLDAPTVEYFKALAAETGIPFQTLISLHLRDCAESKRELNLEWRPEPTSSG